MQYPLAQTDAAASPAAGDRGVLRFMTCGSVDDGKSTLMGRLLYDLELVPTDRLANFEKESRQVGAAEGGLDFALLLDGLEAEQEQGITIDVAYRYMSTPRRAFVIADVPGHEQYTRNMATAASVSEAAVLLVDARKGILPQTRRHSMIVAKFGIRHLILAVNKLDLVDFSEPTFQRIVSDYETFAKLLGFAGVTAIPIVARHGDNVARPSRAMPWYKGSTLLQQLEAIDVENDRLSRPFRMAVQWVCRPDGDFRGLAGPVLSGSIRRGDRIAVAGSGIQSTVARLAAMGGDIETVAAGEFVMIVLADEIDVSRGDVLCHPESRPHLADQFAAHLLWLTDSQMIPGRSYLMKIGTRTIPASITALKHRIDVNSGLGMAARTLASNELAFCNFATTGEVAFDRFEDNRDTGAFILIDRSTHATAAAGVIEFPLRRAGNVRPQELKVSKQARIAIKGHRPAVLWMTGLSGAGKSTIANVLDQRLNAQGVHTYLIDGDNLRGNLNRDLGFTDADRVENIRRVAEVARLFVDAGVVVIVSLISPFRSERERARDRFEKGEFIEIFVDTPIDVCRERDPKGLYAKVAAGELKNFTGIDSPYEPPQNPDIRLLTVDQDANALVEAVMARLRSLAIIPG